MLRRSSQTVQRKGCEIETASPPDASRGHHYPRSGRRKRSASLRLRRFALYIRRNQKQFFSIIGGSLGVAILLTFLTSDTRKSSRRLTKKTPFHQFHHHLHHIPSENSVHEPIWSLTAPKKRFERSYDIVFQGREALENVVHMPQNLSYEQRKEETYPDFAGLNVEFLEEDNASRTIWRDTDQFRNSFRHPYKEPDDDFTLYYAFDDDILRDEFGRNPRASWSEDEKEANCRRVPEHRLNFPTCNTYHEIDLIQSHAKYLNAGAYRQVLVASHEYADTSEKLILKDLHFKMSATLEHYEYVRLDAIVAERLTASPRIYDIYAMCGLGLVSEFFQNGDMARVTIPKWNAEPDDGYDPQNNLTPRDKLIAAKQMADALADLHGYEGGVIVHQDIQLSQFLWSDDKKTIKLNDFNRAEFMLYNEKEQEYCKYYEGQGMGTWRSAEEYFDQALTEKVDIFSMGNNFFGILAGVEPFHDLGLEEENNPEIREQIKKGVKAPIDPAYREHSWEESKLVDLIQWCWEYNPNDRPSIFEIVKYLDETINESHRRHHRQ